MDQLRQLAVPILPRSRPGERLLALCLCLFCLVASNGCAAITNPVADGVPVRRLPPELLAGPPKAEEQTIPLTFLGQKPTDVYRVEAGDVLGVWIPGVLGDERFAPPVNIAAPLYRSDQHRLPPGLGYPVLIRPDGTVTLPQVPPLAVQGMTVPEIQEAVRKLYIEKAQILKPSATIVVTILNSRAHRVVVMRQESGNIALNPEGGIGGGKRGTGHVVDLLPGENDVLHALSQTGGLPGLDAYNEVVIQRAGLQVGTEVPADLQVPCPKPGLCAQGPVVRIPLRMRPGDKPPFRPEDVVLHNGDVVFLEARDADIFFTGGLLPAGQHLLPRDVDLDVIQAITQVRGPLINGAFAVNSLSGNLIEPGIGSPSPAMLTVIRRTPGGGSVPIRVDLDRALRDRRERILVRAGDVLILQERPNDALARYFTQTFLNVSLTWEALHSKFFTGVVDISAPQRIPGRIGVSTTNIVNP